MLRSLRIRNLATISDLEIQFEKGLSILTGETGAGKSILIDGIRLIAGEKGSTDKIRTGEEATNVESIFQSLSSTGQPEEDESLSPLYVQRIISEKGPGKGYLDGRLAPLKTLRLQIEEKVDIYGQNDHVFLRRSDYQLDYLDHFSGCLDLRRESAHLARELRKIIREKNKLEKMEMERSQRLDFLEYQINEIEAAEIRVGEEEELRRSRDILKNSEKIETLTGEALAASYEEDGSMLAQLGRLKTIAETLAPYDGSFQEFLDSLNQFDIVLTEFSDFLIKFREKQSTSPEELERQEERLDIITRLKRKYGDSEEAILAFLSNMKKERSTLDSAQERLDELQAMIDEGFKAYIKKAGQLYEKRKKGALLLEKEIAREIGFLGMTKARFSIRIDNNPPDAASPDSVRDSGTEDVEFLVSPNPGEDLKAMRKIASGGELSRIMLALKSIGKDTPQEKTLIFDEIDSGIGGKVAEFVALKLEKLARHNQVICITHLPQIACRADHHYLIDKKVIDNRTFTSVRKLTHDERVREIARLIAGSRITETVLENAREMLAQKNPS
jgi:DNA repair protein RecN (Recombination protein N)